MGNENILQERVSDAAALDILCDHLYRHTGMDTAFLRFFHGEGAPTFHHVAEAFVGWLMCVEYVHDLARPPHLDALRPLLSLTPPLRTTCRRLIEHLRARHPETYAVLADVVEAHVQGEFDVYVPRIWGRSRPFAVKRRASWKVPSRPSSPQTGIRPSTGRHHVSSSRHSGCSGTPRNASSGHWCVMRRVWAML